VLLDVTLPAGAAPARTDDALRRCVKELLQVAEVKHTLSLTDNPLDQVMDRPCVLVQLAAADSRKRSREQITADLRTRLNKEVPEALVRLRDLSAPGVLPRGGYPIDLAISGPELAQVRRLANTLAERLGQGKQLSDVWANAESAPRPGLHVEIDRAKATALGVSLQDVLASLEVTVGAEYLNGFVPFARTVHVRFDANARRQGEDLKRLKVRNARGEMVTLSDVASVQEIMAPVVLDRLDGRPMVEITANPAPGVSPAQARAHCERLAGEVRREMRLSDDYRVTWLGETPAAK
jgi:multidrug efflux pump subunit AcrB